MFLVEVESGKPSGICKKRKRRFILLAPIIIFMIGIIALLFIIPDVYSNPYLFIADLFADPQNLLKTLQN